MATYNPRIRAVENPFARAWLKYNWRDVHINKFGFFGALTGPGGAGKSEFGLLLAFLEDMEFDEDALDDVWCWNSKKYLRAQDEYKKRWIFYDDAGTSKALSSKNWMKLSTIIVEDTSQLQRIKMNGSCIISQNIGFIDNRIRALFQWFMDVKRTENKPSFVKIHRMQVSQIAKKLYFPYPLFIVNDNPVKLRGIRIIGLCPDGIRNKFHDLEKAFKEKQVKYNRRIAEMIEESDTKLNVWEMIEEVTSNRKKYENAKGEIDASLLRLHLNIGRSRADEILKFVEKG